MTLSSGEGFGVLSPAQQLAARTWQRWPIIIAVALIGGVAAGTWSFAAAVTTWSGTTALSTQSQNRSPDQDSVLALGYVDYFNQDTYQELLRAKADIPDDVELSAQTAATSPIFYITASGPSAESARAAAVAAADQYRSDVRDSLMTERRQAVDDLQAEIDRNFASTQRPERTDAERAVILEQIRSLQGRLTEFAADNTNLIKQLQPEPGMTSTTPSPVTDIAVGLLAGAMLGVALAILLVATDNRLRTEHDLSQRLGLRTFGDFGAATAAGVRHRVLTSMANELELNNSAGPGKIIAVVSPRRSTRSSALARELAELLAARRTDTLLLLADLQAGQDHSQADRRGLGGVLAGDTNLSKEIVRRPAGYDVLTTGSPSAGDSYLAVEPERLAAVAEQARGAVNVTIVDVPPVLDVAESQLFCANADHVIIVVERGVTRVADLRQAIALLAAVHAPVTGAVIELPSDGAPESETASARAVSGDGGAGPAAVTTAAVTQPARELVNGNAVAVSAGVASVDTAEPARQVGNGNGNGNGWQ